MKHLGYRPSRLAQALALRRTQLIGLVVSDIVNPFFSEIVDAVERAARTRQYIALLCSTPTIDESTREYVDYLVDQGIAGLLMASANPRDSHILDLRAAGVPVVLLNRRHPDVMDCTVIPDLERGSYMATKHLTNLGHQRIAHITGPSGIVVSEERELGYRAAIKDSNLRYRKVVRMKEFSPDAGRLAIKDLMGDNRAPSAVFAANDYMALGVLQGLRELGLKVPDDVAVMGYDDIWLSKFAFIDLSTVSSQIRHMAALACNMLIDLVETRELTRPSLVLAPELVVRGTCGARRAVSR
jgi:DNA-binding LacI/PurR family transcriptional regulator